MMHIVNIIPELDYYVNFLFFLFFGCFSCSIMFWIGFQYLSKVKEKHWILEIAWYICVGLSGLGIIVHEIGHWIMAKLFHIEVARTNLLSVNLDPFGMEGHVDMDQHNNFIADLCIAIGPIISNIILIMILYIFYWYTDDNLMKGALIFMMFSLFMGALPSGADIMVLGGSFKRNFKQGIATITFLSISSLLMFFIFYEILGSFLTIALFFSIMVIGFIFITRFCSSDALKNHSISQMTKEQQPKSEGSEIRKVLGEDKYRDLLNSLESINKIDENKINIENKEGDDYSEWI
ncbi:MAG: hypothetical protein EAX96_02690 [Candidatus Lokiarchaeota archaeon]|nr:hypothetical protein [Candidatus Lokiarchaeota archaeon]